MKAANRRAYLWNLQNGKCCWCGKSVALAECTLEHILPASMGGGNQLENTAISHELCNKQRGSNFLQEPHPSFLFEHVRRRLRVYHQNIAKQDVRKLNLPVPAVRWSTSVLQQKGSEHG